MNSRGFLRIRLLVELITGVIIAIGVIDVESVRFSHVVWFDVPLRLLLAAISVGLLVDAFKLRLDI